MDHNPIKTKLEGQGLVEYALILVLVSILAISLLTSLQAAVGTSLLNSGAIIP